MEDLKKRVEDLENLVTDLLNIVNDLMDKPAVLGDPLSDPTDRKTLEERFKKSAEAAAAGLPMKDWEKVYPDKDRYDKFFKAAKLAEKIRKEKVGELKGIPCEPYQYGRRKP